VDARILVELLLKHGDKLPVWKPETAEIRALRQWVESRRMLVGEKVRLTNRITSALKNYYPQVLDWFEDKDTRVFCDFVQQYPTVTAAQAAPAAELTQFFRRHGVVRWSAITRRIEQIANAGIPLTEDIGIVEPMQWLVEALMEQLKLLLVKLLDLEAKIEGLFNSLPDAALFSTLPGAGPHLAPRLLAAFGSDRSRFKTAQELQRYSGIAPVRESSGKKNWVHWQASPEGGFPSVGNWRVGVVRFSCARHSWNGRISLDITVLGHRRITECSERRGIRTQRRCGH